jgi:hypothetical protein
MSDVETIELSIEQAKAKIKKSEALDKLSRNPDFKELFIEGYMKDYAVRLVHLKASMGCQDEKNQEYIVNQLNAIGQLNLYMQLIHREAEEARNTLEADRQELERVLEEGA